VSGGVSVYVSNTANIILDIDGYFWQSAIVFNTVTPCRVIDTRNSNGDLGGPYLWGNEERDFPCWRAPAFRRALVRKSWLTRSTSPWYRTRRGNRWAI
jgi:hypothetical protein